MNTAVQKMLGYIRKGGIKADELIALVEAGLRGLEGREFTVSHRQAMVLVLRLQLFQSVLLSGIQEFEEELAYPVWFAELPEN